MRRPGFLSSTAYWFGNIENFSDVKPWRRSSSRPADKYYAPQTKIAWYDEFWVEEPVWEQYLDN